MQPNPKNQSNTMKTTSKSIRIRITENSCERGNWVEHATKVHYRDSKDSTHNSDSVNVQTDYKNSIIYRHVSQKRHLKI